MADYTIPQYQAANTIDGTNDLLLLYQNSTQVYKSINRSTLLGVTGQPADLTTTQTLTNKTLGTTNSITQLDGTFTLSNTSTPTKLMQFSLSALSAGTSTLAVPNFTSDTMVLAAATQTLTSKTLTSPTINGGTVSNATINANTITGYTTSNSGSIYGISVTTGAISSALTISGALTLSGGFVTSTSPVWQYLGYAQITSSSTTSSSTPAVGSNQLGVSVTVPTGATKVKVTVTTLTLGTNNSGGIPYMYIFSGASVGTLTTQLQTGSANNQASGSAGSSMIYVSPSAPSAGAIAYTVAISNSGSDVTTLTAASTAPAFILVECC